MELPIELLKQLDEYVNKLDTCDLVLSRHIAIREVARLLICITQDEYYGTNKPDDKCYDRIANACYTFVEQ